MIPISPYPYADTGIVHVSVHDCLEVLADFAMWLIFTAGIPGAGLLLMMAICDTMHVVGRDEHAVVTRGGTVRSTNSRGLLLTVPFADTVSKVNMLPCSTTLTGHGSMASGDLPVTVDVTACYVTVHAAAFVRAPIDDEAMRRLLAESVDGVLAESSVSNLTGASIELADRMRTRLELMVAASGIAISSLVLTDVTPIAGHAAAAMGKGNDTDGSSV